MPITIIKMIEFQQLNAATGVVLFLIEIDRSNTEYRISQIRSINTCVNLRLHEE